MNPVIRIFLCSADPEDLFNGLFAEIQKVVAEILRIEPGDVVIQCSKLVSQSSKHLVIELRGLASHDIPPITLRKTCSAIIDQAEKLNRDVSHKRWKTIQIIPQHGSDIVRKYE